MNRGMKHLRALAAQLVALEAKARALGLFLNDRELLVCPKCGLQEDVAFSGQLISSHPDSIGEDTGLRFEQLADGRFRCPVCGAMAREEDSTVPIGRKVKKGKRPSRASCGRGSPSRNRANRA
jgi:rubredoxin